jgi:hypothetical protein
MLFSKVPNTWVFYGSHGFRIRSLRKTPRYSKSSTSDLRKILFFWDKSQKAVGCTKVIARLGPLDASGKLTAGDIEMVLLKFVD